MQVMLKPNWPATFRRSVRDPDGEILEKLEFQEGNPLDLNAEQLEAVRDDIGASLVLVNGKNQADYERTEKFASGGKVDDDSEVKSPSVDDASDMANMSLTDVNGIDSNTEKILADIGVLVVSDLAEYMSENNVIDLKGIGDSTRNVLQNILEKAGYEYEENAVPAAAD